MSWNALLLLFYIFSLSCSAVEKSLIASTYPMPRFDWELSIKASSNSDPHRKVGSWLPLRPMDHGINFDIHMVILLSSQASISHILGIIQSSLLCHQTIAATSFLFHVFSYHFLMHTYPHIHYAMLLDLYCMHASITFSMIIM